MVSLPPVVAVPLVLTAAPEEVPDPVGEAAAVPLPLAEFPPAAVPVVDAWAAPPAVSVTPGRAVVVAVTVAYEDIHALWQSWYARFSAAVPFPWLQLLIQPIAAFGTPRGSTMQAFLHVGLFAGPESQS
jgi:hypothetical protein